MVFKAMAQGKDQKQQRQRRIQRQEVESPQTRPVSAKPVQEMEDIPNWFPFPELGKKFLEETKELREVAKTTLNEAKAKNEKKNLKSSKAPKKEYVSSEGAPYPTMESREGSAWNYMESNEGTSLDNDSYYLKEHSQPGEIVMHTDWSDWPMLFYHNDKNYYIMGLDPTFMYNYNSELYSLFADITMAKKADDIAAAIKENFQARYFIVNANKNREQLRKNAEADTGFSKVYEDGDAAIYQLK